MVVPVAFVDNQERTATHLWGTAARGWMWRLQRGFAPSVRPAGSDEEWQPFEGPLNVTTYLIPVDEFVSAEIPRLDCPTREEFRKLCDEAGSAERVVELLGTR